MSSALTALVRTNPCASALICALGRNYPRCRNVSASRALVILQSEGENFQNDQVIEALRIMAQAGLGILRWNADAEEFLFAWSLLPATVREMVRTGQSLDGGCADFFPAGDEGFNIEIAEPMLKHRFQLRNDLTIGLELTDNLTKREARKIYKFLRAVAFKVPAWPFETTKHKRPHKFDGLAHLLKSKSHNSEDDFPEEESGQSTNYSDGESDSTMNAMDDDGMVQNAPDIAEDQRTVNAVEMRIRELERELLPLPGMSRDGFLTEYVNDHAFEEDVQNTDFLEKQGDRLWLERLEIYKQYKENQPDTWHRMKNWN